jgi:cellulose synthase/poly-beta-1,6-N-acetylglucosamine synthase-like glycosyltransferase
MIAVSIVAALITTWLLLQGFSDLASLIRVALYRPRVPTAATGQPPRLLILVPAHNEQLLIESCVESLATMRYAVANRTIVVIADNCTDHTAELARRAGAICLERREPTLVGKPRAIAWALQQLVPRDYDAIVIVDADAVVDPGFAAGLAGAAPLTEKAVQPYNDVRNPGDSAVTRMAAVLAGGMFRGAFPLKRRAGLNVPLGCGMCVGRDVLEAHGWTAFSLSEDWEWYAILAARGVTIDYAPTAHLYAQEAKSLGQSGPQRQRWFAGKITTLLRRGPEILRSRAIGPRPKLDALAELSAPGPTVHFGIVVAMAIALYAVDAPWKQVLTAALGASLVRPLGYALIGLASDPQPLVALRAFAYLPLYTIWRLAAVTGALRMLGNKPWIRTERH